MTGPPGGTGTASPLPPRRPSRSSWPRFALKLAAITVHVALGLALAALLFPVVAPLRRRGVIRWWSGGILKTLRVTLQVIGPVITGPDAASHAAIVAAALRSEGCGATLVMNHVSWLDIFVVDAIRPAHFVAKAEIARWPLLGFLVASAGTIFLERGRRHAVREVNQRMVALLNHGELIGLFPEGTTGDGERLLPFHANLMQAALDAEVPVVVAAIRYRDADGLPTGATLYVGETTIVQSLLSIARSGALVAELHLIDAIETGGLSRHEVAERGRGMIAGRLGLGF